MMSGCVGGLDPAALVLFIVLPVLYVALWKWIKHKPRPDTEGEQHGSDEGVKR